MLEKYKKDQTELLSHHECSSAVIQNLKRYPSGDNAQPFSFHYNDNDKKIKIFHNNGIAKHELNPDNLSSLIVLGMILQMMEILSKEFHFSYETFLSLDSRIKNNPQQECWCEFKIVYFSRKITNDFFLHVKTNRGGYQNKPISIINLDNGVFLTSRLDKALIKEMSRAEAFFWKNSKLVQNILKWIHLSKKGYNSARAGFYYKEVNISALEVPVIFLLKLKIGIKYFPLMVVEYFYRKKIFNLHKQTENYLFFTGEYESETSLLDLGKVVYKQKYALSKSGITTHPLSILTFPLMFQENFGQKKILSYDFRNLQYDFKKKLKTNQRIAWIFRVGYPINSSGTSNRR